MTRKSLCSPEAASPGCISRPSTPRHLCSAGKMWRNNSMTSHFPTYLCWKSSKTCLSTGNDKLERLGIRLKNLQPPVDHQHKSVLDSHPVKQPWGTHWEPIGNNGWVLPKNHAGSRCSATLLLKKLTQLCPQRSWQTWCVRLSEINVVNFLKQTRSLLKMLKRIWSEFDKTCSVSWQIWQRRTSWHGQTPFWQTTKFQSEKKCSNQRCSEHNTSDHPYVSCRSQIASCRDVRNHGFSFGCTHQLVISWSPACHQPPRGFWGGPFTLSPVSDISDVSHVSVFSSQAMWHAAVPKKIHIDLWIARPAWVPRGRHPCNGCFLTYNCCCAHLKTADSLMQ